MALPLSHHAPRATSIPNSFRLASSTPSIRATFRPPPPPSPLPSPSTYPAWIACTRHYIRRSSTATTTTTTNTPTASNSAVPPTLSPLDQRSVQAARTDPHHLTLRTAQHLRLPLFSASPHQLTLLTSPSDFYRSLIRKIAAAQARIFLASLYIGKEELQLLHHIRTALAQRPSLRVTILTDALRSTREPFPRPSSASLLATLARDFPQQVDLRLYHTPNLSGLTKRLVGKRFNEGWGLQHMKIYGFDNDVVLSGANLSRDYFTNRKDRYLVLSDHAQIADYLHALVLLVSRFSYQLSANGSASSGDEPAEHSAFRLDWDGGDRLLLGEEADGSISEGGNVVASPPFSPSFPLSSSSSSPSSPLSRLPEQGWAPLAQAALLQFTQRWHEHTLPSSSVPPLAKERVYLVPLLQMGPLSIRQETAAVPQLFQLASLSSSQAHRPATLDLTSGYFSLYPAYKAVLSAPSAAAAPESEERVRIVCAAPESNGFYRSRGVSGWIPEAYTWFERRFWEALRRNGRLWSGREGEGGVEIREWKKQGWTYHAKGIWYTPPEATMPTLFHMGSSNYGSRSSELDLECTFLVSCEAGSTVSRALYDEVEELRRDAEDLVDRGLFGREERKVRWRVRVAAWLVGRML